MFRIEFDGSVVIPALVELLDEKTDRDVRLRVAAMLGHVPRVFPSRFEFSREDPVGSVPQVITSETMTVHDDWPFDQNDRLNYGTRSRRRL